MRTEVDAYPGAGVPASLPMADASAGHGPRFLARSRPVLPASDRAESGSAAASRPGVVPVTAAHALAVPVAAA